MNDYNQILIRIIKYQEKIIGPLAWDMAANVHGLVIANRKNPDVAITGDPKTIVNDLVAKYELLWGEKLGKLECQDATDDITKKMSFAEIPDRLK